MYVFYSGYGGSVGDSAQHLMCISALKKLCNDPSLVHQAALRAQLTRDEQDEVKPLASIQYCAFEHLSSFHHDFFATKSGQPCGVMSVSSSWGTSHEGGVSLWRVSPEGEGLALHCHVMVIT